MKLQNIKGIIIMKLSNRIEQLEKELAELKKLEKEGVKQFKPTIGDEYWFINGDGRVDSFDWGWDVFDEGAYEIGNTFRTKEEAEFVVEKIRTETELRRFSKPFERGESNYYISSDEYDNDLTISSLGFYRCQGTIYFESEEKAEEAIRMVGEKRIKKYIFGSVYDD